MIERSFFVYVLASAQYGTLYVGVTNDLVRRVFEHRNDLVEGFTRKHAVHRLVYFEPHRSAESAIIREKLLKRWQRDWKIDLIEKENPDWRDLYDEIASP